MQQSQNLLYRLVSYFGQAQMAFLILFFGGLFGVLRRAERGSGGLAAAVFVAGSAIVVITPLAIMLEDHLLLGLAAAGADPVIVRAFDGLGPLSFALSGFPQAVVLGGTAAILMARRRRAGTRCAIPRTDRARARDPALIAQGHPNQVIA